MVGAGILGLAVARELNRRHPDRSCVVLEREVEVGALQTGHNSGVIHAGIYYAPGSLKAKLCVAGAREMYEFCEEHRVPHERCGKLIVARDDAEAARLDELERRARANGVEGLRRLSGPEIAEVEPHARGVAALHSANTGIVDFGTVARAVADSLRERGVGVATRCPVERIRAERGRVVLDHARGTTAARRAVFCVGLRSDRLAAAAGADPDPRIVPFRGAYLRLRTERRHLVSSLIYPVPDPRLPFLGVHLSRHIGGEVSLGPTALLAPRGLATTLRWPGTWRLLRRTWRPALAEVRHAAAPRTLARAAADYVPDLRPSDFTPWFAGVRAQALRRDGTLEEDFVFSQTERALHVRNAPSPAATSAFAIAREIADRVERGFSP